MESGGNLNTGSLGKTGVWLDKGLDKWRTNPGLMLYKHLRGTYALWRMSVLLIFITIVITLFLQILLLLGAF